MEFGEFVRLICSFLFVLSISSTSGCPTVGKKWAVLIAGSNGWENYRHQADVCHAYHVMRRHGIPEENIITFMYDDIAHNELNPYPGKIFNNLEKIDVYKNVVIDYRREDVNFEVISNVLLGREEELVGVGSGKVLKSGPKDKVFIFYADHGNTGLVGLPLGNIMTYEDLLSTLEEMYKNKQYEELLFHMESCHSASMFTALPNNIKVFATAASNVSQSSFAAYCSDKKLPCLGDQYSVSWLKMTEKADDNDLTVGQLYKEVKHLTTRSDVCWFGDSRIEDLSIGTFFGHRQLRFGDDIVSTEESHESGPVIASHEHDFHYLHKQLIQTEAGSEKSKEILMMMISKLASMKHIKGKMDIVVRLLSLSADHFNEITSGKAETKREHGKCFNKVLATLMEYCVSSILEKEHMYSHSKTVLNLCSQPHLPVDHIVDAIKYTCKELPHEKADLEDNELCWMGPNVCNILCSAKGKHKGMEQTGKCDDKEVRCICKEK